MPTGTSQMSAMAEYEFAVEKWAQHHGHALGLGQALQRGPDPIAQCAALHGLLHGVERAARLGGVRARQLAGGAPQLRAADVDQDGDRPTAGGGRFAQLADPSHGDHDRVLDGVVGERGGPAAGAAAARLFAGDFSPEVMEAFGRLVIPLYAAPGHEDVPAPLMALTALNSDIAAYFFQRLAPHYDVRPHLAGIDAPTLVVVGRHDWVCRPAAGRALADAIPDAQLVELPDAGHFGFSETPEPFLRAVREHVARIGAGAPTGELQTLGVRQ